MKRYVVIATTRRGVIEPPEVVNAEADAMIRERLFAEAICGGVTVKWNKGADLKLPPASYGPCGKVERMMDLAAKARMA